MVVGPVTYWSYYYYDLDDINNSSIPGEISLEYAPTMHTVFHEYMQYAALYSQDINGDGHMDLLGVNINESHVIWWENVDGSGSVWTEHTIDSNYNSGTTIFSQDMDGDGDMDVLAGSFSLDGIVWWENEDGSGTSWTKHTVDTDFGNSYSVFAQDIDGDGHMDVIGTSYSNDAVAWWENDDGAGTSWTEHSVDDSFNNPRSVFVVDINGDGTMDILGAASQDDAITWWENENGSGTSWTERTIDDDFDDPRSVYAEDMDGDGDMDVLGASYGEDLLLWWENADGAGLYWFDHNIKIDFGGANCVSAGDINNDGYMDAIGGGAGMWNITWWENDGGTGWNEYILDGISYPIWVGSEDINGDGYLDIVGGCEYKAGWYDVMDHESDGYLESNILNIQISPEWQDIDWSDSEPSVTSLGVQVRSSNDPEDMGDWSDTLPSPGSLSGVISDQDSLFQYRVVMSTSDPDSTPVLKDITVSWIPFAGIEGYPPESVRDYALHGAIGNPAFGAARISFALPVDSRTHLTIYDLSGRVVGSFDDSYSEGVHQVHLNDLASGVYVVRMTAGEFDAKRRFVVIR